MAAPERGDAPARVSVRRGVRLVGGGAAVGGIAAPLVTLALVAAGTEPTPAAETAFAFGGLWFGLGLVGWSGSVASGRAIEAAQERLDAGTGWTERKSRRAMARVSGFGAGAMLVAVAIGSVPW